MDRSWLDWVAQNVVRQCEEGGIRSILLENNFDECQVREALDHAGRVLSCPLELSVLAKTHDLVRKASTQDYLDLSRVKLTAISSENIQRYQDDRLQLYTVKDFLDGAGCDEIAELVNTKLRPSTVTFGDASTFRTSSTCDLAEIDSPLVAQLDRKISDLLGISLFWSEDNQGQKYQVGQEFKAHTDWFQPNSEEFEKFAREKGQRTWTFMIYLNTTDSGGETLFTRLNHAFKPVKGMAVVWNNLNPDGSPNVFTEHHGTPVVAGEKLIITKWFRDKGIGPVLV